MPLFTLLHLTFKKVIYRPLKGEADVDPSHVALWQVRVLGNKNNDAYNSMALRPLSALHLLSQPLPRL